MSDLERRIEALTRLNANLVALLRDVDHLSDQVRSAEASALHRRSAAKPKIGQLTGGALVAAPVMHAETML